MNRVAFFITFAALCEKHALQIIFFYCLLRFS